MIRLLLCVIIALLMTPAWSVQNDGVIYNATLNGVINVLSSSYVSRAITEAEVNKANALVLQLDTPGGLESSMREITKKILGSRVPVVVYVAPSGGRAASAGMFITISAHIAAMAPGTNIGAAHPVALGEDKNAVMSTKIVQDAAALARSLAVLRGRNATWAEKSVKESVSATSEEALRLGVIDVVARSKQDLLRQINGKKLTTTSGPVTLNTLGVRQVNIPMTLLEKLLHIITDPNIAYLLLSLGVIGIIAELYNPGTFVSGLVGVISLVLAFVALGSLPIGWAGIGLLILAVALLVGELFVQGFGALGVGAIVAFVLGSLLLFVPLGPVSPSLPTVYVSLWMIALMTLTLISFLLLVGRKVMEARRRPVVTGMEALIGQHGRAVTWLSPIGRVMIRGEEWTAESIEGHIEPNAVIEVDSVAGVVLYVIKARKMGEKEELHL